MPVTALSRCWLRRRRVSNASVSEPDFGLGVCLIYLSCFPDNGKPPKPSNDPALVVALRKAGMHSLTPRTFMWVSVASGVTASVLLLMVTSFCRWVCWA